MLPLIALVLTGVAAAVGAVLAEPLLVQWGVPAVVLPFSPFVLFGLLLVPALVLSGDWLWVNGGRREGPGRFVILSRVCALTAVVAIAVPVLRTERALDEVARGVVQLVARWVPGAQAAPVGQTPLRVDPTPDLAIVDLPVSPTGAPPVRRWGPSLPEPTPTAPVLPHEGAPLVVLPVPPPDGTFFVYEWVDPSGDAHYSDDFNAIPTEGRVLRAIAMKPSPAGPAPAPVQPKPSTGPERYDPTAGGLLPSMAEQYWRGRFTPALRRIKEQEKRIAAKQEEINNLPAAINREFAFAQLRKMKDDLKGLEQDLQDLERDASHRAVPREWRE